MRRTSRASSRRAARSASRAARMTASNFMSTRAPPGLTAVLWAVLLISVSLFSELTISRDLAKRERKDLDTGIEEFDLKGHVLDRPHLPDELIHPWLLNLASAVGAGIDP